MQERLLKFEDKTSICHPEANVKKKHSGSVEKHTDPSTPPAFFF